MREIKLKWLEKRELTENAWDSREMCETCTQLQTFWLIHLHSAYNNDLIPKTISILKSEIWS